MRTLLNVTLLMLSALLACERPAEPLKVIAHRGYWKADGAAQNSIAALRAAGELGIYGTEFDVWMTADGELVVNHDSTFHGIAIDHAALADLRRYTLCNGEPIPTLGDYLKAAQDYPQLHLVLELKSDGDTKYNHEAFRKVLDCIYAYGVADRTSYISFSLEACKLFAEESSRVQYLDSDHSVEALHAFGIKGIDSHYSQYDRRPSTVSEAHSLGMTVNTWTVNTLEDAQRLRDLGVDMVTTDEPELLREL